MFGQQPAPQENLFKEHGGHGLPTKTFTSKLTLGSGNDRIELRYYGRAHTSGDAFVIFPALKVAHVGDVFPNKGLPIMDRNNGGSGVAYAETVDKAAKDLTALGVESLINGHTAAQTTVADLREYGAFVREFVAAAHAGEEVGPGDRGLRERVGNSREVRGLSSRERRQREERRPGCLRRSEVGRTDAA